MSNKLLIQFDDRWIAMHGIGRVASEMRGRVMSGRPWVSPRFPQSSLNPADAIAQGLWLRSSSRRIFYSPGFNPPAFAARRAIFTIHDLIHVRVPEESSAMKRLYYGALVKPAVHRCFKVLTVSEYSRRDILEWSDVEASRVLNVGNGVDERFFEPVTPWVPGWPYYFYIGARKAHKNLDRLLVAYASSAHAGTIKLVLSGEPDAETTARARELKIEDRLVFAGRIPEEELPAYYQGAVALLFPSTFEGFGLPPVEAMAGGVPVMTSNTTSLPEVVGSAALQVDPFSVEALRAGMEKIAEDESLRRLLREAGPVQARTHSWERVAAKVNGVLDALIASTTT